MYFNALLYFLVKTFIEVTASPLYSIEGFEKFLLNTNNTYSW